MNCRSDIFKLQLVTPDHHLRWLMFISVGAIIIQTGTSIGLGTIYLIDDQYNDHPGMRISWSICSFLSLISPIKWGIICTIKYSGIFNYQQVLSWTSYSLAWSSILMMIPLSSNSFVFMGHDPKLMVIWMLELICLFFGLIISEAWRRPNHRFNGNALSHHFAMCINIFAVFSLFFLDLDRVGWSYQAILLLIGGCMSVIASMDRFGILGIYNMPSATMDHSRLGWLIPQTLIVVAAASLAVEYPIALGTALINGMYTVWLILSWYQDWIKIPEQSLITV